MNPKRTQKSNFNNNSNSNSNYKIFFLSFLLLFLTLIFAVSCGSVHIPVADIIEIILGEGNETTKKIIFTLRLPRIVEAATVGAGLAVAGTFFQGLLRNPMADPYVLGVSSGAAFGATIAIVLGLGFLGTGLTAFLSALLTIYVVYVIAKSGVRVSMTSMLLAGIAISAFLSAVISLLMLLNHEQLTRIIFWTMGSFSLVFWDKVYFSVPLILLGSIVLYFFARDLNVIMTGEETAEHLGINTEKVKRIILILSTLITASAVSTTGIIGFVGLIVPHISRLLVGSDNRILVPFSALIGAIFLLFTDTLARTLLAPAEIPAGIITATLGGPFFLYLLVKSKKKLT